MSTRPPLLSRPALGQSRAPSAERRASSHGASALPHGRISVGRLSLKMPVADGATARRIVQRASELAADRVPAGLSGHLSGLSLKVRPRNLSEAAVTEALAEALVAALRRRGGERA